VTSAISLIAYIVYLALSLYFLVLFARFALDLVQALSRSWRPKGFLLVVAEIVYTVTDPPLRFFRRLIPPLRIGPIALDFGFTITLLIVIVAMNIVTRFI
jgi:YggT family protein